MFLKHTGNLPARDTSEGHHEHYRRLGNALTGLGRELGRLPKLFPCFENDDPSLAMHRIPSQLLHSKSRVSLFGGKAAKEDKCRRFQASFQILSPRIYPGRTESHASPGLPEKHKKVDNRTSRRSTRS